VGHEGRLSATAKNVSRHLMSLPEWRGTRCANEEATEIFVEIINLLKPNREGPDEGGEARAFAEDFAAGPHDAPEQRDVRRKFRRSILGAQFVQNSL
jgi:hypothetical protein